MGCQEVSSKCLRHLDLNVHRGQMGMQGGGKYFSKFSTIAIWALVLTHLKRLNTGQNSDIRK